MAISKKILIDCSNCKSKLLIFPCKLKNRINLFCSSICHKSFYSKEYVCKFCNKSFRRTNYNKIKSEKLGSKFTFCSMKCYKDHLLSLRVISICPICTNKFSQTPWKKKSYRFCSDECKKKEDQRRENGRNYRNGAAIYRVISREKYGETCHSCGSAKFIEVHHLDRNRKNNTAENLRPLCRECHHAIHKNRLCLVT